MKYIIIILQFLFLSKLFAQPVIGTETAFQSFNGITEVCSVLSKFPASENNYSSQDIEEENFFCSIDLYQSTVALCPKTWSTSPATMIYNIEDLRANTTKFEAKYCRKGTAETLAKFKTTMNQAGTAATVSMASVVYYHFSRYFRTDVYIPVAVYRSMDRKVHYERVVTNALRLAEPGINLTAWQYYEKSDINPELYQPKEEVYTDNDQQIYGILLHDRGERYGSEITGVRLSKDLGRVLEFQRTAPFMALKTEGPLLNAIAKGIETSFADRLIKAATGSVSNEQMIFWMKELTEITILDFIFSQSDRVHNVDYRWYWYWVNKEGESVRRLVNEPSLKDLPRTKINKILKKIPRELKSFKPILLQRSQLNDNDAAIKGFSNYTQESKALESIRHMNANTYQKLIALNADLNIKGPMYQYYKTTFAITDSQVQRLVNYTQLATEILKTSCKAGLLKFDLEPLLYARTGEIREASVVCE